MISQSALEEMEAAKHLPSAFLAIQRYGTVRYTVPSFPISIECHHVGDTVRNLDEEIKAISKSLKEAQVRIKPGVEVAICARA